MSDSKSGSKGDLNESNMPLLEAEEKNAEKSDIPEKTMEVRHFLYIFLFRIQDFLIPYLFWGSNQDLYLAAAYPTI
jgi:hypothetical protein